MLIVFFQSIECLARRLLKKDTEAAKIVGCGLSGSAMLFFPNISIVSQSRRSLYIVKLFFWSQLNPHKWLLFQALYVFWKAIEV